jgi:hypothetical protein
MKRTVPQQSYAAVSGAGYDHNANTPERFWSLVDIRQDDECWIWKGTQSRDGYGKCAYHGKSVRAHRKAYELINGPIPANPNEWHGTMVVRHACDTKLCCNPRHLLLGTTLDNNRDKVNRGRQRNGSRPQKGEQNHWAKLTIEQVVQIRELYTTGHYSQSELGRMFNVHQTAINLIVRHKNWKHI